MNAPRLAWILVLLTALALGGCGTSTGSSPQESSGLRGVVRVGPQCPVVEEGQSCPDQAAPGATVTVRRADAPDSEPVATATADEHGAYQVALPPGEYAVTADAGMLCKPRTVRVPEGTSVEFDLACDSGIR